MCPMLIPRTWLLTLDRLGWNVSSKCVQTTKMPSNMLDRDELSRFRREEYGHEGTVGSRCVCLGRFVANLGSTMNVTPKLRSTSR